MSANKSVVLANWYWGIVLVVGFACGGCGKDGVCGKDGGCGKDLPSAGQCEDMQNRWLALATQAQLAACVADSDCEVVGQSGSCGCSNALAADGLAVSTAAYASAGGPALLEAIYGSCTDLPMCCDCGQRTAGCVNRQCALTGVSMCCGCPDGQASKPVVDASRAETADVPARDEPVAGESDKDVFSGEVSRSDAPASDEPRLEVPGGDTPPMEALAPDTPTRDAAVADGDGSCSMMVAEWRSLVGLAGVVSCTTDSECEVVGQSGSCSCSNALEANGLAVNTAAYASAGGPALLETIYGSCSNLPMCCDCGQRTAGCVNGQCALVGYSRCCGCPDGSTAKPAADAADGKATGAIVPTRHRRRWGSHPWPRRDTDLPRLAQAEDGRGRCVGEG
jgi:hypothetical protein